MRLVLSELLTADSGLPPWPRVPAKPSETLWVWPPPTWAVDSAGGLTDDGRDPGLVEAHALPEVRYG
jgi:hypothetical protein